MDFNLKIINVTCKYFNACYNEIISFGYANGLSILQCCHTLHSLTAIQVAIKRNSHHLLHLVKYINCFFKNLSKIM